MGCNASKSGETAGPNDEPKAGSEQRGEAAPTTDGEAAPADPPQEQAAE